MNFSSKKTLAVAVVGACLAGAAWAEGAAPHWEYTGKHGATGWGHIDKAYETCGIGKKQSPINIQKTVKANLAKLEFNYKPTAAKVTNNGHTIQVNVEPGNTLKVGDKTYELVQFHFHSPSEEALGGRRTPMNAHFVHKDASGALGVVTVLFEQGKTSAAYAPVFKTLPKKGENVAVEGNLDMAALLPVERGYYNFEGSLTTPPCSEGVNWMVLKSRVKLGGEQIKAYRRLYNANARPIQPLNGRVVQESK